MSNFNAFKVGDVCVVVCSQSRHNGEECVIVTDATTCNVHYQWGHDADGVVAYGIKFASSRMTLWSEGKYLRLKRPPSTDDFTAGEWELCPWRPKRVEA